MNPLLRSLLALHDGLTRAAAILSAIGLIAIVALYVLEVVTRYFFNSPTSWGNDFVTYALATSTCLALPAVTRDKGHVAVTILVDSLRTRPAAILHVAINVCGFLGLGLAAWISLQENLRQFHKGITTLAIVPVPQWWISSFITFGLALSAIYMLRHARPAARAVDGGYVGRAG